VKGQTLEARVFSGIFPRSCVEVREYLGENGPLENIYEGRDSGDSRANGHAPVNGHSLNGDARDTPDSGHANGLSLLSRSRPGSLKKSDSGRHKSESRPPSAVSRSYSKRKNKDQDHSLMRALSKGSEPSRPSTALPIASRTTPTSPRDPEAPKPPAPVPMLKIGDETPTYAREPLVDEIGSCLREWHSSNLHEMLLARQYSLLDQISVIVQQLDFSRKQLLHDVLTRHELKTLRSQTVWNLVKGNKLLGREVIVRDPIQHGRILTGNDSSVEITQLQSMMSLLDAPPETPVDTVALHHLMLESKAFIGISKTPTTLVFGLYSLSRGLPARLVSEPFQIEFSLQGLPKDPGLKQMKTLFTDLSSRDIGEGNEEAKLFLVVKCQTHEIAKAERLPHSKSMPLKDEHKPMAQRNASGSTVSTNSKAGRMSLMWGQKSTSWSRNASSTQSQNSRTGSRGNIVAQTSNTSNDTKPPASSGGVSSTAPTSVVGDVEIRRNVAIGALHLTPLLKNENGAEKSIKFWAPIGGAGGAGNGSVADHGEGWENIIADIMESRTGQYDTSDRAERVHVFVKLFSDLDADSLIKNTPTLLHNIPKSSKIGFSGAPTKSRSDIYLTVTEAYVPRNAVLSHPRIGGSTLSQHVNLSTMQLSLEVRKTSGEKVPGCIFSTSNGAGVTVWKSTATARDERWNDTIRLAVPDEDVPNCHLYMSLSNVPGLPIAFSWMPLWDQQAFVRDGDHSLYLYKADDFIPAPESITSTKPSYLSLPWNSKFKDDGSHADSVTGPMAMVRLNSYLCSTRFSQDKVLLGLLKWREGAPEKLTDLLKQVVFVPEIEIVKLLSDVFDALFGILVEHAGKDEYEDLVFNALVTVLGIVYDRRFNMEPVVDAYAATRFNYPFATPCLLRSFSKLLTNPTDGDSSRKLRSTFKVGRHIFKFIINARGQQKAKEADIGITSTQTAFTRDLERIFKQLESLMRLTSPIAIGSQTLAVQHFHTWLPELSESLAPSKILLIAIDFLDSCDLVKGKLILYKLLLIINYSKSPLFAEAESKRALLFNTARWLAPHWGKTTEVSNQYRDQVRLCCTVLSLQVEGLTDEISEYIPKIIDSYCALSAIEIKSKDTFSMLFPASYPFMSKAISPSQKFEEVLIELAAILAAMINLPNGMPLGLADAEMAEFLFNALRVHKSILSCEAFPESWLSLHIYQHKSTMRTLETLANILVDSFLPHPDEAEEFNTELWRAFFETLLQLVGSESLALETFPEQKRRAVWKIAGDVREHGADLLRRTWEAIGWETTNEDRRRYGLEKMGGYQVQYVPSLVAPIVELCLSVHEGLRSVAVEVLQTMLVSEWTLSEDLSVVQTEMIDCLDALFKQKNLSESILQKLFIHELLNLFEPLASIPDDPLFIAVKELIATIDEYLDLLVAVHSTHMAGEAFQILDTLRLMEFLKDMQKEDIFIRYVHQLNRVQVDARNYVEAGLALKLHADLYSWDPSSMVESLEIPSFPKQSSFERKESLYFEMIKHYEDGNAWQNAIGSYKELAHHYENTTYDFPKLARAQRAMANIYEKVAKSDGKIPRYFRVVYSGLGFPVALRDKAFICEGSPMESTSAFTDRMQQQHPSASIIAADAEMDDFEGQFLQISSVHAHNDLLHPVFQKAKVINSVRTHLLTSQPNVFSVSRRMQNPGDPKDQWVEKILYTTADAFPTILKRSEIISVGDVQQSPIQSAIERTVRKTQEMTTLEKKVSEGKERNVQLLTTALKSSLDPGVQRDIASYHDLLPTEEIDEETGEPVESDYDAYENALRTALLDHAIVLKRSLATHGKFIDHQLKPTHDELVNSKFEIFAP
jgi:dedicator of cytokinesis protein 3